MMPAERPAQTRTGDRARILALTASLLLLAVPTAQAQIIYDIPDGLVEIDPGDGECSLAEAFENISTQSQVHADCPAGELEEIHEIRLPPGSLYEIGLVPLPSLEGEVQVEIFPLPDDPFNRPIIRAVEPQSPALIQSRLEGFLGRLRISGLDLEADDGVPVAALIEHTGGTLEISGPGILRGGEIGINAFDLSGDGLSVALGRTSFDANGTGIRFEGDSSGGESFLSVAASGFFVTDIGVEAISETVEIIGTVFRPIGGYSTGVILGGSAVLSTDATILNTLIDSPLADGVEVGENATVSMRRSTVDGADVGIRLNHATADADIRNSTFSGMSTAGLSAAVDSSATLNNVTFAFSNIAVVRPTTSTQIVSSNSIFANNTQNCSADELDSDGHNLDDDGSCISASDGTSIFGQDPLLGPLADNGGFVPTWTLEINSTTHALDPASPAIGAGHPGTGPGTDCEADDQRGVVRPQGPGCDIGAFELQFSAVELNKTITAGETFEQAGDVVEYLLVATNTGDAPLNNVVIDDPDLGALDCQPVQPADLAPEETLDCTGSYTITAADAEAGFYTNTALVSADPVDGLPVGDEDSATASGPAVFVIPDGAVAVDGADGVCSLVEAFMNIGSGDQFSDVEGECPRGSPVLNTVILAEDGSYLLEDPGGMLSSYLDFFSVPVRLEANRAEIFRPALGDSTPVFDSFADFEIEELNIDGGGLAAPLIVHGGDELSIVSSAFSNAGIGIDIFAETPTNLIVGASNFTDLDQGIVVFGLNITSVFVQASFFTRIGVGLDVLSAGTLLNAVTFDNRSIPGSGIGVISDITALLPMDIRRSRFADLEVGIDVVAGELEVWNTGFYLGGTGIRLEPSALGADIRNATFSALELGLDALHGTSVLNNATFAFNQQAIQTDMLGGSSVTLANSILADSSASNCSGDGLASEGFNLDTDGTCASGPTDLVGLDPLLGPIDALPLNLFHPLQPGSPAISASFNPVRPCESVDQRGIPRPQDGNNDGSPACDIGAFELEGTPESAIELVKTIVDGSPYAVAGDLIQYQLLASNTGNTTLLDVEIIDPTLPGLVCSPAQPAELSPNADLVCTGSYAVSQDDVVAGSVINTASVSAEDPLGNVVTDQDTVTAERQTFSPAISLSKTATAGAPFGNVNDLIEYSLVATNTGNVALEAFGIADPLLAELDCSPTQPAVRQPGESMTCTGSYTVTQADIDSGSVLNTASASGRDLLGTQVDAEAVLAVQGPTQSPALALDKRIISGSPFAAAGDRIDYRLEMRNTGNVTLDQAHISDPALEQLECGGVVPPPAGEALLSRTADSRQQRRARSGPVRPVRAVAGSGFETASAESVPKQLAPGASLVCTGSYEIEPSDLQAGRFINVATASAFSPADEPISAEDTVTAIGPLLIFPTETDLGQTEAGEPFFASFSVVGGQPPYHIEVGTPEGFASLVGSDSIEISGSGVRPARLAFEIRVDDSSEPPQQAQRTYHLQVVAELQIDPAELADGRLESDYFQALRVSNGIPPFRFEAGGLPPGILLERNVISGVPTQTGNFEVLIAVEDAQGNTGFNEYMLEIRPAALEALEIELPDAVVGVSYGHQLRTTSRANPVIWGSAQGLPPGLELQYTGFITGSPSMAGSFQISATAVDGGGQATSIDTTLLVRERGLMQLRGELPPGLIGNLYNGPLLVYGTSSPFECVVSGGELPSGLQLDGCDNGIIGTPLQAGTFEFELQVTNTDTPTDTQRGEFTIRIADPDSLVGPPSIVDPVTSPLPAPSFGRGRPRPDLPDESLQQMVIDDLGHRILVGYTYNGKHYDILLHKYDADGKLLWSRRHDSGNHDYGYGVAVNPHNQGIYVSGYSLIGNRYDGVILSFDEAGVLLWERRVSGGVLVDALYAVTADRERVYVAGERFNGRDFDALFLAFDHNGNQLWQRNRTTATTQTAYALLAADCATPPCDLLVAGSEGSGLSDGWLLALDSSSGNTRSERDFPGTSILAAAAVGDGFVIGGDSAARQWRIIRLNSSLQLVWQAGFADGSRLRSLVSDADGFVYAAGNSPDGQDALLKLLSPSGEELESRHFDTGASERFTGVGIGPEGQLTVSGVRREDAGNRALLYFLNTGRAF